MASGNAEVHPLERVATVALQAAANVVVSATWNSPAARVLRNGIGRAYQFSVAFQTTQAGTLRIEYSRDGTGAGAGAWRVQRTLAIAGATTEAANLTVPIVAEFYRVSFVNGAAAADIVLDAVATH